MSVNEPPSREKVLVRIMKLLALAEDAGAAENEVKSALAQARRLMLQHGIDEAAVQPLDLQPTMAQETFRRPKKAGREHDWGERFAKWERRLASYVAGFFSCQVVFTKRNIIFLGYQADAEVARHAFDIVLRKMWNLVADRTREHNKAMKEFFQVDDLDDVPRRVGASLAEFRASYVEGLADGFRQKLEEEKRQDTTNETAIVHVKDGAVKKFVAEVFPKLRGVDLTGRVSSQVGYSAGREDAKTIGFEKELKG